MNIDNTTNNKDQVVATNSPLNAAQLIWQAGIDLKGLS